MDAKSKMMIMMMMLEIYRKVWRYSEISIELQDYRSHSWLLGLTFFVYFYSGTSFELNGGLPFSWYLRIVGGTGTCVVSLKIVSQCKF
jgi:hypothetical protein